MRTIRFTLMALLLTIGAQAAPLRIAVLEFTDETGQASDKLLGGSIDTATFASKGIYPLTRELLKDGAYVVIDRRELLAQMDRYSARDDNQPSEVTPSFLRAAQALRADFVLRGKLLGFSTDKKVLDQAGYKAEFSSLSLRVGVDVLDATDGTVVAMEEGSAAKVFRQTDAEKSVLGENAALEMLGEALRQAAPQLRKSLEQYAKQGLDRPKVNLTILTEQDPALVAIDGILVGSTPLRDYAVYAGDHVINVSRPGYRGVNKRILVDSATTITVPLLRAELTADEIRQVLENAKVSAYMGLEPALIIEKSN